MPHRLEQRVALVRRSAHRLQLVHAGAWLTTVVLLTAAALAGVDFLVGLQDRGVRILLTIALALVTAACGWRFLWPAWRQRLSAVAVAQRIERQFPQLQHQLASAVSFLRQPADDAYGGSAELRRAVVHETDLAAETLDFRAALDRRPAKRALAVAGVLLTGIAIFALLEPQLLGIAARRLANPWSAAAWPQRNHLRFRQEVRRLALGQTFEVEVVDSAGVPLPEDLWIVYRQESPSGDLVEDRQPVPVVQAAGSGSLRVAHRDAVARPFSYRVVGGDDSSMAWIDLEVVEPPALESLSVTLHPPAYTGWPAQPGEKHLRALAGTKVALEGTTTKPLRAARLALDGGQAFPLSIDRDGYHFSLSAATEQALVVERTCAYWFEFEDREGLQGGRDLRYEMQAVADMPPVVSLDRPEANLFVTPQATIPVRVSAREDLALRAVELVYSRSDRSGEPDQVISLFAAEQPAQPAPGPAKTSAAGAPGAAATASTLPLGGEGESRVFEHRLELASMELRPGVLIDLRATASDFQPATSQSPARRIAVVAPAELEVRLAERQTAILAELSRVLKLQQDAHTQVAGLDVQISEAGRLAQEDIDRLQAANLAQRKVQQGLIGPEEGVNTQIAGLLADLENNALDSPDIKRRMEQVAGELQRLGQAQLPAIERELTAAEKGAAAAKASPPDGANPPRDREMAQHLADAGRQQKEVIAALEQVVADLGQWDTRWRAARALAELGEEQKQVAEETAELARETLSRGAEALDTNERAQLKKLAGREQELARRLQKIEQGLADMSQRLDEEDPLGAAALEEAAQLARQSQTASALRQAGQQVERNQMGQALETQRRVAEQLAQMLDALDSRREQELARLVRKLRESEAQLAEMRREQDGLRRQARDAEKLADPAARRRELERLSRQEQKLQEQAERLAKRLQRLQAASASKQLARAGQSLGQAGQQADQGQAGESADAADQAQRDLDEAQQQLAERRRQAEADLAAEQLAKLQSGLESLRDRQREVNSETVRYDELRKPTGNLTRGQQVGVLELARTQLGLADQTGALAKKLAAAAAFALALDGAFDDMIAAVEKIRELDTGPATQAVQRHALARLEQLLAALEPDKPEDQQGGQEGAGEGGQQAGGQQGEMLPDTAQLKLLKLLQLDINERTRGVAERMQGGRDAQGDAARELERLSVEQGKLADLVRNLSQPAKEQAADDPEAVPELPLEDEPNETPERTP
ncbi:MAG: hypothetical protein K2Y37_13180 [Pirellulales bacterium]|nr:hypothetical protein [Pirellulales bacterium]